MKKHKILSITSHGSIILSAVFIVLFVIDRFNPSMDFLGSDQSDWLLLLFCLCSFANGIITAECMYKHDKAQYRREKREHEEQ